MEVPRQDIDGLPHFSYYDTDSQLSFDWDGKARHVQVSGPGGGGEVKDTINVYELHPSLFEDPSQVAKPEDWLCWFKVVCDWYLDRVYPQRDQVRVIRRW